MSSGVEQSEDIRRVEPDNWADWRSMRLRSLTEDPQAFSASTLMWTGERDTEQRWRDRLSDGPCFLAYDGARPVGMVAGRQVDAHAELISMWVAPEARGRGVGSRLIESVIAWAGDQPLALRVFGDNLPAVKAYESHGFVTQDEFSDEEGCGRMWLHGIREKKT